MKNPIAILAAFIGGAIVGGALGVLFAPESGEETRRKIADALEKRGIKLSKREMEELIDELNSEMNPESK